MGLADSTSDFWQLRAGEESAREMPDAAYRTGVTQTGLDQAISSSAWITRT